MITAPSDTVWLSLLFSTSCAAELKPNMIFSTRFKTDAKARWRPTIAPNHRMLEWDNKLPRSLVIS